jgi:predicted aspartyl protease
VALLDTGASNVAIESTTFDALPADGRPVIASQSTTVKGTFPSRLSRLRSVGVGPDEVESVLATVLDPSVDLLAGLRNETGEQVIMLLGGSVLSRFMVTIDYQTQTVELRRYRHGFEPALPPDPREALLPDFR